MGSHVAKAHLGCDVVRHDIRRRPGHHDLAAVGGGNQTSRSINCRSEVVAVTLLTLAGVQGHAHPQHRARRPWLGDEGTLSRLGRLHGVFGCRKGSAECVPHGLEDVATRGFDRRSHEVVVTAQGVGHGVG